jgi:prepilin-type N-terminal cleavage/methylation domain-containing protein
MSKLSRRLFSPQPGLGRRPARPLGFTLIELLVVIAIITLIIAILIPVLAQMSTATRRTKCLSNQRSLAHAIMQYTMDNNGRLCSPRTEPVALPNGGGDVLNLWVNAIPANLAGQPDGTTGETVKALETGVLWNYTDQSQSAYKSPLDTSTRLRSYSMNAYVGNVLNPNDNSPTLVPSGQTDLSTSQMSSIIQPANTFCTVSEDAPGFNKNGWLVEWNTPKWDDVPAIWDGNKFNASFMDGSSRTLDVLSPAFADLVSQSPSGGFTEPGDPSAGNELGPATWLAVRQMLLPGRLPY